MRTEKSEATDNLILELCIVCWSKFQILINRFQRFLEILFLRTYATATIRQQHRFLSETCHS